MPKRVILGLLVLLNIVGYALPVSVLAQDEEKEAIIISDLDWNPDGTQIAIGIGARKNRAQCVAYPNIQFLNVTSLKIINIPHVGKTCSVTNMDFSPDGVNLITTSGSDLELWNVTTGQRLQDTFMFNVFQHASWSPKASTFLDVYSEGVDIRNAIHGGESEQIFTSSDQSENKFFTDSVWSSDGSSIASSLTDGTIYVWDTTNTNILQTFSTHTAAVRRLVWNWDLNLIASGDDSGKILIWNPSTGEIAAELKGHTGAIRDLDWRADGQELVSAGADNTVRRWAWPSGEMQLVESDQSIWSVAYSPDGSQLAYGGELSDEKDIVSHITIVPTGNATVIPQATIYNQSVAPA